MCLNLNVEPRQRLKGIREPIVDVLTRLSAQEDVKSTGAPGGDKTGPRAVRYLHGPR